MTNKYYFASFYYFIFLKDIYNTLPGNIPATIAHETLLHTAWFVDVVVVDSRRDQC